MTAHEVHEAHGAHLGSLLIAFGRAGDLFDRRPLFLTGVAVFTVASPATGLAGSEWQLVAARAAQGVGAAMVSPTARPPRHRRVGKCEWTRH
jgi:MFS family permease